MRSLELDRRRGTRREQQGQSSFTRRTWPTGWFPARRAFSFGERAANPRSHNQGDGRASAPKETRRLGNRLDPHLGSSLSARAFSESLGQDPKRTVSIVNLKRSCGERGLLGGDSIIV